MKKRFIFLQSNINNHVTFCLGSTLNSDQKQQKRAAISLKDLIQQIKDGFDYSNKAVRNFLCQCEVLLKQDVGYDALESIDFHIAMPDAKSLQAENAYIVQKDVFNQHLTQVHKLLSRPTKGLAIAGASALVLALTAMGLSLLPEVGQVGVYAGLGLVAVALVLGVSAMISHYRSAPVLTHEQNTQSVIDLANSLGVCSTDRLTPTV